MLHDIRTQKYGLGRLFSEGWGLYKINFKAIAKIAFLIVLPFNFLSAVIAHTQSLRFSFRVDMLLGILVETAAVLAIAYLVEQTVLGQKASSEAALGHAVSRWSRGVLTQLLAGAIVFCLLLLLIVPGVIWGVYYAFSLYVVALRGRQAKSALDYSKWLVSGQWGRVFGIILVISIVGAIVAYGWTLPFYAGIEHFFPESDLSRFALGFRIAGDTLLQTVGGLLYHLFTVMTVVFFLNVDYLKQKEFWGAEPTGEAKKPVEASRFPAA